MSKYREAVLKVLSEKQIKSTHEILQEVETLRKKSINWHLLYRVLTELESEGLTERLESKAGIFWRKK